MKRKNLRLKTAFRAVMLILMLCWAGITKGFAYDFSAVCETGQTLYYNITDAEKHYIALTYPGTSVVDPWDGFIKPTDALILPKMVEYNSTLYYVTSIGYNSFYGCSGLTALTIPNSVTSIGDYAIRNCSGLTSITIPNSVTSIGEYAFNYCSGLTSITIPNSVTSIGNNAFSGSGLTSVIIPNSVTSIGNYTFSYCSGLTSVIIPNSVTSIGDCSFYCSGLTSITIPNTVTSIGAYAFYSCSELLSLTIGNSVASIGTEAFRNCSKLASITIPNSVASIGQCAFKNCIGLTTVFWNAVNVTGFFAPNSFPFHSCSNLSKVVFGDMVSTIPYYTFYGCSSISEMTVNATTPPTIGSNAFYSVNTNIPIYIPSGLFSEYNSISWGGFTNFIDMGTLPISFEDANVKSLCVANWDTNGDGEISYTEAAAVTSLGTVFRNKGIRSFNELQYFTGLNSIGYEAFAGCYNLRTITLSNSITSIGEYAFNSCNWLSSIEIPASVTSIESSSFECCGFSSIVVNENNTVYDSRNNCNAIIKTADNKLITGCKNTIIPNDVITIGNSAFSACMELTSIVIPNSVTTIEYDAFNLCQGLTTVTIGSSVSFIGSSAFYNCQGLSSITVLATTPPTLWNSGHFDYVNKESATVYVPNGSKSAYKAANGWNEFSNYVGLTFNTFNGSSSALWNNTSNWSLNSLPTTTSHVTLAADATVNTSNATIHSLIINENVTLTINNGAKLTVTGTISQLPGSSIIIENGGQLVNASSGITATVKQNITQWTTSPDNGWQAISTPVNSVAFGNVTNLTSSDYNVYRLDETTMTWENSQYSGNSFTSFDNGRGYLYRKGDNTAIEFRGTLNAETAIYQLSYTETGFHLIGNPYPHKIYKGANAAILNTYLEDGFYRLTSAGGWVAGTDNSTAIAPCQAILVQAKSTVTNNKLYIRKTTATGPTKSNDDNIIFIVSNSNYEDVAYALFKDGHGLNKIDHRNADIQKLYIQHNGEDFAIVNLAEDEQAFNLNFHATTTGKYTLNVKADGNFSYLHLIDKLTGEDIDLLLDSEYSFIGASSDKDNRFIVKLKYASTANDDDIFAYQNGNKIVVNGEGNLQIYDVLGRYVMNREINGVETVDVSSLHTGVYILRMTGNSIKTQKIVVK